MPRQNKVTKTNSSDTIARRLMIFTKKSKQNFDPPIFVDRVTDPGLNKTMEATKKHFNEREPDCQSQFSFCIVEYLRKWVSVLNLASSTGELGLFHLRSRGGRRRNGKNHCPRLYFFFRQPHTYYFAPPPNLSKNFCRPTPHIF